MISQFDYSHIKAALVIASELGKDVGTDGDQKRIAYAMRLLELNEIAPTHAAYMQEQCALYGAE